MCDVGEQGGFAAIGGEGEERFDLGVFGEGPGVVEGDGGAVGVEFEAALLAVCEGGDDVVDVAEGEVGDVEEDGAFCRCGAGGLGFDLEAGEDGGGEGAFDGSAFRGVGGARAELEVVLDEEDFGAGALEADDAAAAELAAIKAKVVLADAAGQGVDPEVVRGGGVIGAYQGDLEVELAGFCVPIQRQQAGLVLHGSGLFLEGLRRGRFGVGLLGVEGQADEAEECQGEWTHGLVLAREIPHAEKSPRCGGDCLCSWSWWRRARRRLRRAG